MKTKKYINPLLWLVFMTVFSIQPAKAQSFNDQLRALFSGLALAPQPAPFLYDMSVHTTDEKFYTILSFDQSTTLNWWSLYFEMYHSNYGGVPFPSDEVLREDALELAFEEDVIPIGLMDLDYNIFKSDAFDDTNNGKYFSWTNTAITDVPGRIDDPYEVNSLYPLRGTLHEIFAVAPLWHESYFKTVDFAIDPRFIFYGGPYTSNIQSTHILQIDFGDGVGWRTIDPTLPSRLHAIYPGAGDYTIKARVLADNGMMIKHSMSKFTVRTDRFRRIPDSFITDVPGLKVGVFRGCNPVDNQLKPVIYLEGIDILENTGVSQIYDQMIHDSRLVMLKNFNYDFVVVSWRKSTRDMRDNAMSVVSLIERLKCMSNNDHQFVVIGESMGGVIGRFALAHMETPGFINSLQQGINTCMAPRQSHNTRLFITLDSPHQGAYIPISVQHQYEALWQTVQISSLLRTSFLMYDMINGAKVLSLDILNSPAVRQLLVYHSSTRNPMGQYTAHAERTSFMNDLNNLNPGKGGWPSFCKNVALADGDMRGRFQTDFSSSLQMPNMNYIDLDLRLSIKFLRLWNFEFFRLDDYRLKSNPNGSGPLIEATVTTKHFTLIGCLLSIFNKNGPGCVVTQTSNFSLTGNNLVDMDRQPGGSYPAGEDLGSTIPNSSSLNWWVFKYKYTTTPPASISLDAQIGLLNPLRIKFSLSSELPVFCFIPLQSAFDYGGPLLGPGRTLALNHDIFNDGIAANLSRTPIDVVVAKDIWWTFGAFNNFNAPHWYFRRTVLPWPEDQDLSWLTREIGEERMHLDNLTIKRTGLFQSEQYLNAGFRANPHYNYTAASASSGLFTSGEALSKGAGFIVDANLGDVTFKTSREIRLRPGFEAKVGSKFLARIEGMANCNFTYGQLKAAEHESAREENPELPEILSDPGADYRLYPNPSFGDVHIAIPEGSSPKDVRIFDLNGEMVWSGNVAGTGQVLTLHTMLSPGLYSIRIADETKVSRLMVIIQNP